MPIYLVQHGIALPKDEDPKRGLSSEGIRSTNRIAEVAAEYQVEVSQIVHSGKTRAEQTANILAKHLFPTKGVIPRQGLAPKDDIVDFAATLTPDCSMFVGHLPFLSELTSFLITGSPNFRVFSYQNSGIVCLDRDGGNGNWTIRWTLMPNIGR